MVAYPNKTAGYSYILSNSIQTIRTNVWIRVWNLPMHGLR